MRFSFPSPPSSPHDRPLLAKLSNHPTPNLFKESTGLKHYATNTFVVSGAAVPQAKKDARRAAAVFLDLRYGTATELSRVGPGPACSSIYDSHRRRGFHDRALRAAIAVSELDKNA